MERAFREVHDPKAAWPVSVAQLRPALAAAIETIPSADITDGFHSFKELYAHRRILSAIIMRMNPHISWRSKAHHSDDEPMFEGGYFIVGMDLPTGQISYHYKLEHWSTFDGVTEIAHAPKWDGHDGPETVLRLQGWLEDWDADRRMQER
jgi:hypothetical protein